MNNTYIVQWKSKVNGRAGKGTKQFQLEEGQRLVEVLNHEYPQIHHELVESPGPNTPAPTDPVAEVLERETEQANESALEATTTRQLQAVDAN